jgi:hypothetical protein
MRSSTTKSLPDDRRDNSSCVINLTKAYAACAWQVPWRGIFHCSGFFQDRALADIQRGDLEHVAGPKNSAALWLHQQTLDHGSLEIFAVVSSTSADVCTRNTLVYGATNALLNSFVRYRRSLGLPACALNMTSLSDVGIVANDPRIRQAQVRHSQSL